MGALERLGLRASAGGARAPVVGTAPARALARVPVVRSGTALEVAEIAWVGEGISRETALTIPTVSACRDLIVGTVVQLGLFRYRGTERLDADYLLSKPDPSTTLPATMGGTVDDLLFYGRAYWRVLERDPESFARRARWTPFADVTPKTRSLGGSYSVVTGYDVAGVEGTVAIDDLIRFDSPIPGVLDYGGPTLAAALELEQAARRLAAIELPAGTLTNLGEQIDDDEAATIVAGFQNARHERSVAWLQNVEYKREQLNAADLQMIESRANVATDVSRLFNVPVAMVGASPSGNATALLYSNLSQQLAIFVATGVAPHLRVIEDTLGDATPRGQSVAFDVQTYLRSDPQAAADYAIALLDAGVIDKTEARSLLGIPSSSSSSADLTPGRV